MFKIIVFLIILIFGAYFTYNVFKPSFFSKTEIVHIKADNILYDKDSNPVIILLKVNKFFYYH